MSPVKLRLTKLDSLGEAAERRRALAHPHRLRMVQMLLQGEPAVVEVAETCERPSVMASEDLRLMQRCGFLTIEKEGRNLFRHVAEPHLKSIPKCIEDAYGTSLVTGDSFF